MADREAFDMEKRNQNAKPLERGKWGVKREALNVNCKPAPGPSRFAFHASLFPPQSFLHCPIEFSEQRFIVRIDLKSLK